MNRDKTIMLRLTADEKKKIEKAADSTPTAVWARQKLLDLVNPSAEEFKKQYMLEPQIEEDEK